ncbi:hypothetical protein EON63_17095 [archaeon]|nr:MAG: hypothetical protein EON63_17095 [archaeon]
MPTFSSFHWFICMSYILKPSSTPHQTPNLTLPLILPGNLRQITVNDLPVGRNVDEILRLVKAFQFVEEHGEVCPANWQPGELTMKADPTESKVWVGYVYAMVMCVVWTPMSPRYECGYM